MAQLSKMLKAAYNASIAEDENTVLSGVAGKRIRVYGFTLSATLSAGLGAATINSGTAGDEKARFGTVSGSIVILPVGKYPWFSMDVGDDMIVTNLTAPDAQMVCQGNIMYRYED